MRLNFFGSLSKKKAARDEWNGTTLPLDLDDSMPPPFIPPAQYAPSYNPPNARILKTSKSWFMSKNRRGDDVRGHTSREMQGSFPVAPANFAVFEGARINATTRDEYDHPLLQNHRYYDDAYDIDFEKAYQSKMDRIESWRQKAHGVPEVSKPQDTRPTNESSRTRLKLHRSGHVVDGQRYAEPSIGDSLEGQAASSSRRFDKRQFQQEYSSNPVYPACQSSRTRTKSSPNLPATRTNDALPLLYPTQIRNVWCANCRSIPPDGTTCVHGVSGFGTKRRRA